MTVKEFKEKIASAAWNQNIFQFCERAGFDPKSDYAQEKFQAFQELAALLNKFDSETLARVIGAEIGEAVSNS